MMPYCEYRKCKRVANGKARLLRMWDSYDAQHQSHAQVIYLCNKHRAKIHKLLQVSDLELKDGEVK